MFNYKYCKFRVRMREIAKLQNPSVYLNLHSIVTIDPVLTWLSTGSLTIAAGHANTG